MTNEEINNLVNNIGNAVSNIGGATASIIGSLNGGSGRVSGGGTTYVYGNEGNTNSLPSWLLPLAICGVGAILIFKH